MSEIEAKSMVLENVTETTGKPFSSKEAAAAVGLLVSVNFTS